MLVSSLAVLATSLHLTNAFPQRAPALLTNNEQGTFDGGSSSFGSGQALKDVPGFTLDLTERRLVQFGHDEPPRWITELEKYEAKARGVRFFDVTDTPALESFAPAVPHTYAFPKAPQETDLVGEVISKLSTDGPERNLETFTSFRTRHYRSETGKESQKWLLGKISEVTNEYATPHVAELIDISEFEHSWGQNSIILKIAGSAPSEGAVVISAHLDSTNMWPFLPAPGADDDGSGTVGNLEAYRALISSNFTPTEDVYFHWYAAEEAGLLGSQAVVHDWAKRGVKVKAQVQFDMTAFVKKGTREEVGVVTDFTDPELSRFIKALIDTYLDIPWAETRCGYGCSDHASWHKAGYPAAFPFEAQFSNDSPYVHTANDRINFSDEFSFSHLLEYSKLAVAFAIELGGWKQ